MNCIARFTDIFHSAWGICAHTLGGGPFNVIETWKKHLFAWVLICCKHIKFETFCLELEAFQTFKQAIALVVPLIMNSVELLKDWERKEKDDDDFDDNKLYQRERERENVETTLNGQKPIHFPSCNDKTWNICFVASILFFQIMIVLEGQIVSIHSHWLMGFFPPSNWMWQDL